MDLTKAKHRYVALDSLRGVCACMVVMLHFQTQGRISALPIVQHGFLFVDFFFVLSGFVIGSSYGERLREGFSVPRFMALRLGRIYPLHIVMLMVFLAFEIVFALFWPTLANREPFTGTQSVAAFIQSLFLVQIFFGPDATSWNGPSWSIAAELWTYLIFALLLRYRARWLLPVCGVIVIGAPIFLALNTDRFLNVFHDGALVRCLFGFALGMVGWRCAASAHAIRVAGWVDHLIELVVVATVMMFVSLAGAGPLSLAAPLVFLISVLVFAREKGICSRVLKLAPFVLLGTLSYSIYMIHGFLYYRFLNGLAVAQRFLGVDLIVRVDGHSQVGGTALFGDGMTLLFVGIVVLCSVVSYRLVEMPGQRLARRLVKGRDLRASHGPPS
ncbi:MULTISPECIES: acyltransferase family protein [Sphingobium]|uniref:acyltransferase family protein n=1 Tax=Sphingobium TaxID=165695 RepID=UPI0015EC49CF|nr:MULTISPECIES: acyltransferase [Sphingobium]MCW2362185.1 peptidoglycan/LPS O-acetylase OafA/YrhL [Sphingobium sp. B10D3B]MCW2401136.1 peptidoglycan/LPS O-acetylase OafA/YrhL [Sphingobium sp. B10D7B]MCW2408116.1 peptidoglycan/LPS O-acetylase OafA/YrhL [Sphingobium xanthum]